MKPRHKARVVALKVLYEIDCAQHKPTAVVEQHIARERLPDRSSQFVRDLVQGVLRHQDVLDEFIHRYAPDWPLDQMAYVDRNVLRMALYEFAVGGHTPVKVAINEAVELAKTFGSDSSPRFVNGVLGTLVEHQDAIKLAVSAAERRE